MLSIKKVDAESRKGLLVVMAEVSENEGDYEAAARYYTSAARQEAVSGNPHGLTDYVKSLIDKSNKCRELYYSEREII